MSFRCEIGDRVPGVLLRGLQTAGLDPEQFGVRIRLVRGAVQTSFAGEPEPGDTTLDAGGVRLFVDPSVTAGGPVSIEVTGEHDQITLRRLG